MKRAIMSVLFALSLVGTIVFSACTYETEYVSLNDKIHTEHVWTVLVEEQPATCDISGTTAVEICKECNSLRGGDEIAPTGHSWQLAGETSIAEGYDGFVETYSCANCSEEKSSEELSREFLSFEFDVERNGYVVVGFTAMVLPVVTVPAEYEGKPVVGIAEKAFFECNVIVKINITVNVKFIGASAFENCVNLSDISVFGEIAEIGEKAFFNTAFYLNKANWIDGALYLKVTRGISPSTEEAVAYLIYVEIEVDITVFVIRDGTIGISDGAFSGCTQIVEITVPISVVYFTRDVFRDLYKLTKINYTGTQDEWNEVWVEITIDVSITVVFIDDVEYEIVVNPYLIFVLTPDGTGYEVVGVIGGILPEHIIIPEEYNGLPVIGIAPGAFKNCTFIVKVVIVANIVYIGDGAFEGCVNLIDIRLPDVVEYIGEYAFDDTGYYNDENNWTDGVLYVGKCLVSVKIDVTVFVVRGGTVVVADGAFKGCAALKKITLPITVVYIPETTFIDCVNLEDFTYEGTAQQFIYINVVIEIDIVIVCSDLNIERSYCGGEHLLVVEDEVAPTCSEYGYSEFIYCGKCGKVLQKRTLIDKLPHAFGDYEIIEEPTYFTEGLKERTCSVCGSVEQTVMPKLNCHYEIIEGRIYFVSEFNVRQINITVDGRYFNEYGYLVADKEFISFDGVTYYLEDGFAATGYRIIAEKLYYFGADFAMLVSGNVDGFVAGENGVLTATDEKGYFKEFDEDYMLIERTIYKAVTVTGKIIESDADENDENNPIISSVSIRFTIFGVVFDAQSGIDGLFSLGFVPVGDGEFIAEVAGYFSAIISYSVSEENVYIVITLNREVHNTLTGKVTIADGDTNSTNNAALSGAQVTISRTLNGVSWVDTTTTDNNGNYTFTDLTAGVYDIKIEEDGYITINSIANVKYNQTTVQNVTIEAISSANEKSGVASGRITDAATGYAVAGVALYIRAGVNNTRGEAITSVVTGSDGSYEVTLAPGNYTAQLVDERQLANEKELYVTFAFNIKVLSEITISNQNASASNSKNLNIESMRIILTWGASPSDLDSHLNITRGSKTYHVYYGDKNPSGANANLDIDDVSSYGPETITVTTTVNCKLHYYVYDFSNGSNSSALTNSGAKVTVYFGASSEPEYTFYVPSGKGGYWHIFSYDYATGEFTIQNVITTSSSI